MGIEQGLFLVFAAAACGGAVAVVVSQNVVRMAFWLIVSLGSVAGLFFLLNADFVAATQLLIYVGGTVVLLVFGVMLTASGPYIRIATSPAEGFLAGGVGLLLLALLAWTVFSTDIQDHSIALDADTGNPGVVGNTTRPIGGALLGVRYGDGAASGNTLDRNTDSRVQGDGTTVKLTGTPNLEGVQEGASHLRATIGGGQYSATITKIVSGNELELAEALPFPAASDAGFSEDGYVYQLTRAAIGAGETAADTGRTTLTVNGHVNWDALATDGSLILRVFGGTGRQSSRIVGADPAAGTITVADSLDVGEEQLDFDIVRLQTGFLLPFEIVSVHLLVVLIGAAYLARAKRRVVEEGGQ